jgi:peroxiredoxin
MKKITLILLASIALLSCNKDGYEISGTATGIENGKKVFLEVPGELGAMMPLDTVTIEDGKFNIKGKLKEGVELAFIKFEGNGSMAFILENGSIAITFIKDSIQNSIVGGTKNNDLFQTFNNGNKILTKKAMKFQADNQAKYMAAMQSQDTITIKNLQEEMKGFEEEMNNSSVNFVKDNKDAFISILLLENIINSKALEIDEIKTHFNNFDKKLLETKAGKKLEKVINTLTSVEIGKEAPNFSAPNPEGKMISLKESLGKVTIIDFWASWCAPCRAENPNVVAMYNELHEKGLNIIGVSLDKDATKWKEAIAKDGLTWNQVSNLKFWQEPIAEQYNVKSIPATFILDEKGVIVAKDLRGEELKAKIIELLGQ